MVLRTKKGFTLVELLIVMVILIVLAVIMTATINPVAMIARGRDAQRKKDLGRIRVAFEDYFNDRGCYPSDVTIAGFRCGTDDFRPWLSSWPCDPNKKAYRIFVESGSCPKWFKATTNLENRKDNDIPTGWYNGTIAIRIGDGSATNADANYGVSSSNVLWSEFTIPAGCNSGTGQCYTSPGAGMCQTLPRGSQYYGVFVHNNCDPQCQVPCCYNGDVCN